MFRTTMAAFAAFAASACTIGLPSAVDAAPFEARMVTAPFADGIYCGLDHDADDAPVVETRDEDGDDKCMTFTWDASQRLFAVRDGEGKDGVLQPVDLGDSLFLMQFPIEHEGDASAPYAFILLVGAAHGDAIAILPLWSDEKITALAAHYPGVALSTYHAPFTTPLPAEADGSEPSPPARPDPYYISAGPPEDIRQLARDIALSMLRQAADQSEASIPLMLRDSSSQPSHPPSSSQQRDADAIAERLHGLARRQTP